MSTQSESPPIQSRVAAPSATIAFGTLLLCAIAALAVLLAWRDYRGAIEKGEAGALSSAHVVAAHFQWMLQASDQALRRIDSALGPEAISEITNTIINIEEAIGDLPRGFQYSVYDETGQLRFSSVKEAIGINVSDRGYFQELREGADTVISPLLDERLSNESVFVVARRIVRSGKFHGAASIAIPAARMAEFWRSMNLGPFSTVAVIRTDGWLVARFPALRKTMDLSNTHLLDAAKAQSGVYHSGVSPADGRARIVGFWRVEGAPIIALAGIERGEVLAAFWRNLLTGTVIAVPLFGMLGWGLLWTARLQRADETRRLELERSLERKQQI